MKLGKAYSIIKDCEEPERIRTLVKKQFFENIADYVEFDKPYSVKVSDVDDYRTINGHNDPRIESRKMIATIEPIPQFRMKYISPEKMYLSPSDGSFIKKIRNCITYLKDKTGGKMECEEIIEQTDCQWK